MNDTLKTALDNVEETYKDLATYARNIAVKYTRDTDDIIEYLRGNIETLSDKEIQSAILRIATMSYSFAEVKEYSMLKSVVAETLRKEAYATNFNNAEGTVAIRENTAILDSSGEIVADDVCQAVASILKTKSDELHRVVDALKTVLLARMSEAKRMVGLNSGVMEQ